VIIFLKIEVFPVGTERRKAFCLWGFFFRWKKGVSARDAHGGIGVKRVPTPAVGGAASWA